MELSTFVAQRLTSMPSVGFEFIAPVIMALSVEVSHLRAEVTVLTKATEKLNK